MKRNERLLDDKILLWCRYVDESIAHWFKQHQPRVIVKYLQHVSLGLTIGTLWAYMLLWLDYCLCQATFQYLTPESTVLHAIIGCGDALVWQLSVYKKKVTMNYLNLNNRESFYSVFPLCCLTFFSCYSLVHLLCVWCHFILNRSLLLFVVPFSHKSLNCTRLSTVGLNRSLQTYRWWNSSHSNIAIEQAGSQNTSLTLLIRDIDQKSYFVPITSLPKTRIRHYQVSIHLMGGTMCIVKQNLPLSPWAAALHPSEKEVSTVFK